MLQSLYWEEEARKVLTSVSLTFENLMIEICWKQMRNTSMKRYPVSSHITPTKHMVK